jgi:NADH-quinone oxidoreductase subunit L
VLAFFSITVGWAGIPEHFPGLGVLLPGFFNEFVGATIPEAIPHIEFSFIPLLTSTVVSLGGLFLGWIVYRNAVRQPDPLEKPLGFAYLFLKNKYYFDEIYDTLFVRPAYWLSETFTFKWLDRGLIDGILHAIAWVPARIGSFLRGYIDAPVINGFGDFVGEGIKWLGRRFRVIQTGNVQQYMLIALVLAFSTLFYFLFSLLRP